MNNASGLCRRLWRNFRTGCEAQTPLRPEIWRFRVTNYGSNSEILCSFHVCWSPSRGLLVGAATPARLVVLFSRKRRWCQGRGGAAPLGFSLDTTSVSGYEHREPGGESTKEPNTVGTQGRRSPRKAPSGQNLIPHVEDMISLCGAWHYACSPLEGADNKIEYVDVVRNCSVAEFMRYFLDYIVVSFTSYRRLNSATISRIISLGSFPAEACASDELPRILCGAGGAKRRNS